MVTHIQHTQQKGVVETSKAVTEDSAVVVNLGWAPVMVGSDNKLANGGTVYNVTSSAVTDYTVTKEGKITIASWSSSNKWY